MIYRYPSILFAFAFILSLACLSGNSHAAVNHDQCKPNCYVATNGNDSAGNGTVGNPWLTLGKCFGEAHPGDTCWFRGGTYTSPTNSCSSSGSCGSYNWGYGLGREQNSEFFVVSAPVNGVVGTGGVAGNPVTIRGYTGETVVFTTPGTRNFVGDSGCNRHILLADDNVAYISFYDLTFKQGRLKFSTSVDHITFERCVFHAGDTNDSVPTMLMSGSTANFDAAGWIVRNNLFISDNTDSPNGCLLGNGQGSGFTDFYGQDNGLIEHNDFIVTSDAGNTNLQYLMGMKDMNRNTTVQYNYLASLSNKEPERGLWVGGNGNSPGIAGNNVVRYNVSNHAGPVWHSSMSAFLNSAHNNTLYNMSDGCWSTLGDVTETMSQNSFFNNICVADSQVSGSNGNGLYMDICEGSSTSVNCNIQRQSFVDNNIYWKLGSGNREWKNNSRYDNPHYENDSTGITEWSNYLVSLGGTLEGDEVHSRVINPGLTNPAAGNFSLVASAAARTGGRGGSYPTFIGADDPNSSSDYFGCNFDPRCHGYSGGPPPTDTTAPAKPTGLRVQ